MILREGLHRKLTSDLYIPGGVGVCQIEKMERKEQSNQRRNHGEF